jgi:hypothetical protein
MIILSIIMPKFFNYAMKRNKFAIAAQQNVNLTIFRVVTSKNPASLKA